MWPLGRVVMRPEPRIHLWNDDLLPRRAQLVDFIGQQSGRVQAMGPNLNFLPAIARNHLVRVDRVLQFRRIASHTHQAQGDGNDVVSKRGHLLRIFQAEASLRS